jgi:hypothetical protein
MKKTLLNLFIFFAFANLSAQDITTDLVFNLSCDSSTDIANGETLTESSSSAAVGTAVGTINSIEGVDGTANTAINFSDGAYINFIPENIANLPLGDISTKGRTYAMWIKTSIGNTRMQIFAYGTKTKALHAHINLNQVTSNSGQINLGFWQVETTQQGPFSAITDNQWHHIVTVINKTTNGYTTKYYVDNALIETRELVTTDVIDTQLSDIAIDFRIGGRNDPGATGLKYTGGIDEFRVYNRALTTADVNILYGTNNGTLSTANFKNTTSFKVYPTITSAILNIATDTNLEQLYIVNLNRVTVKKFTENSKTINVSNLESGIYFIVGKSATGVSTSKFIKK